MQVGTFDTTTWKAILMHRCVKSYLYIYNIYIYIYINRLLYISDIIDIFGLLVSARVY